MGETANSRRAEIEKFRLALSAAEKRAATYMAAMQAAVTCADDVIAGIRCGAGGTREQRIEQVIRPIRCALAPKDGWWREHDRRYVRQDGAVVRYDDRTPYSNPASSSARMWTAWEPDPGERALSLGRKTSLMKWPRRFHTAQAAMRAADRAWPRSTKEAG